MSNKTKLNTCPTQNRSSLFNICFVLDICQFFARHFGQVCSTKCSPNQKWPDIVWQSYACAAIFAPGDALPCDLLWIPTERSCWLANCVLQNNKIWIKDITKPINNLLICNQVGNCWLLIVQRYKTKNQQQDMNPTKPGYVWICCWADCAGTFSVPTPHSGGKNQIDRTKGQPYIIISKYPHII